MSTASPSLIVESADQVVRVSLNRPEVHNAFNPDLISALTTTFRSITMGEFKSARAVVLSGEGRSFCAGADINWMEESLNYTREENVADALQMAKMFDTINNCPLPVVCRAHGAVLGGGIGLAAVSDVVIATETTVWGLSEVKLGIAPAVISPYVIAKIGRSHARSLFLTGERFDSARALQIGLAHRVVSVDDLDAEIDRVLGEIRSAGPYGIARAKALIAVVPDLPQEKVRQLTAETIAVLRVSDQGQEGLRAFLEKRKPDWSV